MLRNRMLMLVGGCLLTASGAWADDLGYVDCSNHSEDTQVFGKARRGPDTVGIIPCGERFTILLNGFIFSRIETKDGKIGYIYSNLISMERGSISVKQADTGKVVEATSKVMIPSERVAQPKPAPVAQPRSAASTALHDTTIQDTAVQPARVSPTPAQVTPAGLDAVPAAASSASVTPQPAPAETVMPAASAATSAAQVAPASAPIAVPTTVTPTTATRATPAPSPVTEPAASAPETIVKAEEPQPVPQPQPAAPEPAARPIREASVRTSWEKPNPGARQVFALELYGGYAFTRYVSGGAGSNFNGAMGSFGWNIKPWIQIAGDSTYSFQTVTGTKYVLWGNHYGPRYFFRRPNRWGITPFVEGLVGGTRADTTITGSGGYTTSQNCISYKVGGGLDMRVSRHLEIRLFDVDYYRTAFGTNTNQNNYWASAGIVLQVFGGGRE